MYYRLSNTASRVEVEEEFGRPFRYPAIYQPQALVNGLEETNLPVITMEDPSVINFAIWGILPKDYKEDWAIFQNIYNTLNLSKESLNADLWYGNSMEGKRCLIVCSGFFTNYLYQGDIYPYFVYSPDHKPFCLGGIYNQLEDGFLTCALIIVSPDPLIEKIQTVDHGMPLVIGESFRHQWLDPGTSKDELINYIRDPAGYELQAHPIAKEFYKNEIVYDTMLEPVHYRGLPQGY